MSLTKYLKASYASSKLAPLTSLNVKKIYDSNTSHNAAEYCPSFYLHQLAKFLDHKKTDKFLPIPFFKKIF